MALETGRKCLSTKADGTQCRNLARRGSSYCWRHQVVDLATPVANITASSSIIRQPEHSRQRTYAPVFQRAWEAFLLGTGILALILFIPMAYGVFQLTSEYLQNDQLDWLEGLYILLNWLHVVLLFSLLLTGSLYWFSPTHSQLEAWAHRKMLPLVMLTMMVWFCLLVRSLLVGGRSTAFQAMAIVIVSIIMVAFLTVGLAARFPRNSTPFRVLAQLFSALVLAITLALAFYAVATDFEFSIYNLLPFVGVLISSWITISDSVAILRNRNPTSQSTLEGLLEAAVPVTQQPQRRVPSAEQRVHAAQDALRMYASMDELAKEELTSYIIRHHEPTFVAKCWAVLRLVLTTFALTIVGQEPAVALLKWVLRTFFGVNY